MAKNKRSSISNTLKSYKYELIRIKIITEKILTNIEEMNSWKSKLQDWIFGGIIGGILSVIIGFIISLF